MDQDQDLPETTTAITWTAVMGLNPSYGDHDKDDDMVQIEDLTDAWTDAMEKVFAEDGILVTCAISPSLTVYPAKLGCPWGGEKTVILSGSSHPKFIPAISFSQYIAAVERVVREVATTMKQESVRIDFSTSIHSAHITLKSPASVSKGRI